MRAKDVYTWAYKVFENLTPIPVDCGMLCNAACCHDTFGDENEAGMYLYYGEEVMLKDFCDIRIENSDFKYGENEKNIAKIAICNGTCDRRFRPLSCRIFPLIPYKKENTPLTVIIDPRAKSMCPLSKAFTIDDFDERFTEAVLYVFNVLIKEKHIKEFVTEQSYLLDEYKDFFK